MNVSWVMLRYLPEPWVDDDVEIGFVATGSAPGRFVVERSEAMRLRETPRARRLSDFLSRMESLAKELAERNGGVLDLKRLLEEVPDRGTSVVFSPINLIEAEDFESHVRMLASKLPLRDNTPPTKSRNGPVVIHTA